MGARPADALAVLRAAAEDGRLDALAARHRLAVLTVFGSAAREDPQARDLDVAVDVRRLRTQAVMERLDTAWPRELELEVLRR